MRTNIVLVEEKKNLWFAGSLAHLGITSAGSTKEEARKNLELILGDMILHNEVNLNSKEEDVEKYIKDTYNKKVKFILSDIDIKDYIQIQDASKSERTNVSIKRGYKILAKARKKNVSDFINKALSKELGVEF